MAGPSASRGAKRGETAANENAADDNKADLETDPDDKWEVQLDDDYEDDDYEIRFDKQSLIAFIVHLEDSNLFKIDLVKDDAAVLQEREKQKEARFQAMQNEIDTVHQNMLNLKVKQEALKGKLRFLSGGASGGAAKRAPKKTSRKAEDQMNATADTTAPDGDKTVQNANDDALKQGAKKKNLKPGMEILREADHECSHETIEKFYSKVGQIMETMKKKSDDKKQQSSTSHSKN